MFINGEWRDAAGGKSFDVFNPADGSVISQVPDGGAEDARAAIEAADAAFPIWSRSTAYARADMLMKAHRLMMERQEELARTMTEEQGKPLRAARTEVKYGADFLQWFAEEAKRVNGEILPSARADQRFGNGHGLVGINAAKNGDQGMAHGASFNVS